jgi:hypothetical protein
VPMKVPRRTRGSEFTWSIRLRCPARRGGQRRPTRTAESASCGGVVCMGRSYTLTRLMLPAPCCSLAAGTAGRGPPAWPRIPQVADWLTTRRFDACASRRAGARTALYLVVAHLYRPRRGDFAGGQSFVCQARWQRT